MPKGQKYTKAQKAAYAKKMAANRKKPKKAVVKQNAFRTEYKDRISSITTSQIAANPDTAQPSDPPLDSQNLLPHAFFNTYTQGSSNGQIDGNQINARFLSMKVELDFSDLPAIVQSESLSPPVYHDQNYHITIRQCLILQDISEYLNNHTYQNPTSGRTQFAFSDQTLATTPLQLTVNTAHRALNRQMIDADFLTYERRQDSKVRVLKTIKVKGNLNSRFVSEQMAAIKVEVPDPAASAIYARNYATPNQHFTFTWKMPKQKIQTQPLVGAGTPAAYVGQCISKSWIPCVLVTCHRDTPDKDISDHPLRISQLSHFTYTDN